MVPVATFMRDCGYVRQLPRTCRFAHARGLDFYDVADVGGFFGSDEERHYSFQCFGYQIALCCILELDQLVYRFVVVESRM